MSPEDLRRLVGEGMTVAAHTWDHRPADRYGTADYPVQFDRPRAVLEKIVRRPVHHFAYPYGSWPRRPLRRCAPPATRPASNSQTRP